MRFLPAIWQGPISTWGIGDIAIAIVMIAAIVALVYVALRQFGVAIPQWVIQIFWIVIIALVAIFAVKLIMGMG